jgi:hypothetical protein
MPIPRFDDKPHQSSGLAAVCLSDRGVDDDGPAARARPDLAAEQRQEPSDPLRFAWLNPGLRHRVASPVLADQAERLDLTLLLTPVLEDTQAWAPLHSGSFSEDWRDLPGTIQSDLGYLAVALAPPHAADRAEAILHLDVPAGIPAAHLPLTGDAPVPTLLLARGLAIQVDDVRREAGQWQVHAQVLPAGNLARRRERPPRWLGDVRPAVGAR